MKKLLLIEDEISVVDFIKKGLTEDDYEVSVALDGATAIKMACEYSFDLLILDIMLPDTSGVEVCKELRKREIKSPILILTALGTSENIAFGLDMGADDYLIKPFKFIELRARIKALLRRATNSDTLLADPVNVYSVADLILNDDAKKVTRNNRLITLTATEYRLLFTLIKNKGKVLSRMELLENAWDINFNLGTNVVDVYINYLRKKIDAESEHKIIHTVVGMGYVIKEEHTTV